MHTSTGVEVVAVSTGSEFLICAGKAKSVAPGAIKGVPVHVGGEGKGKKRQPECSPNCEEVVKNVLSNFGGSIS